MWSTWMNLFAQVTDYLYISECEINSKSFLQIQYIRYIDNMDM